LFKIGNYTYATAGWMNGQFDEQFIMKGHGMSVAEEEALFNKTFDSNLIGCYLR